MFDYLRDRNRLKCVLTSRVRDKHSRVPELNCTWGGVSPWVGRRPHCVGAGSSGATGFCVPAALLPCLQWAVVQGGGPARSHLCSVSLTLPLGLLVASLTLHAMYSLPMCRLRFVVCVHVATHAPLPTTPCLMCLTRCSPLPCLPFQPLFLSLRLHPPPSLVPHSPPPHRRIQ